MTTKGHRDTIVGDLRSDFSSRRTLAWFVLRAEDRKEAQKFHDRKHNDDHEWNDREDQAYKIYGTQKHRPNTQFGTLKENDQQNYWNWRHTHSDSLLKIEIK